MGSLRNLKPSRAVALISAGMLTGVLVGASGAAVATETDTEVIHGCKNWVGLLRVVEATQECHASEQRITWNQVGPAGSQGPEGPIGPRGETGIAGPAGPQGPAGIAGLEWIQTSFYMQTATGPEVDQRVARCPEGKLVLSGGFTVSYQNGDGIFEVLENRPIVDEQGQGWLIRAKYASTYTKTVNAFAVCAAAT